MNEGKYTVMKFGGTSIGAPESLLRAIDIIEGQAARTRIAVVVSAMGDSTDLLIEALDIAAKGELRQADQMVDVIADLACSCGAGVLESLVDEKRRKQGAIEIASMVDELLDPLRRLLFGVSLLKEKSAKTKDLVMSFGERLSVRILSYLLFAKGVDAIPVDAMDWVVTDDNFGFAEVQWEETQSKIHNLESSWCGKIPVITGFLGSTDDGRITTLGRNGSDYTATLLARGLNAEEVIISTDVPGVMTADPSIVKDAYPIEELSYMEALELTNFGARMFHARTMLPLIESRIPLRIRGTMENFAAGTRINETGAVSDTHPTSIASLENQALLDLQWRSLTSQAQVGARLLEALDRGRVTVWMATQSAHGQAATAVVPMDQVSRAEAAINKAFQIEMTKGEVSRVSVRAPVTLISLVAQAMGRTPNVAGRLFSTLGRLGVMVRAIGQGASERSISCAVDAADTVIAVRAVHATFNMAVHEMNLLVLGKGMVGGELLKQIRDQRSRLEGDGVRINVVGVVGRNNAVFKEEGVDLFALKEAFDQENKSSDLFALLERLRRLSVPILVDCTDADEMEKIYERAFALGVHVVSANKNPLAGPQKVHDALYRESRRRHRLYHYETTVGAGLPVIETLQNLVKTGDVVRRIEGSFSSSLGFITDELSKGGTLSSVVRIAKERGFTESSLADDLLGMDVARKALILAREMVASIEFSDLSIEPLVPVHLLKYSEPESLLNGLKELDHQFEKKIAQGLSEGKKMRYLARINLNKDRPTVHIGPVFIDENHPAFRLRGVEAFIAFYTERYGEVPLVVQGAGDGGTVTAVGVLADILKISRSLRGSM